MTTSSTTNVGIFVDSIGSYGRGVTRGILAYQRYRRWQISLMRTWVFQPTAFLHNWTGDGLIAMVPDPATAELLARTGKPVVSVSSLLSEPHPLSVGADDYAVGQIAASHFLDRGFRHFGFFGPGQLNNAPAFVSERLRGYRDGVQAAGFDVVTGSGVGNMPKFLQSLTAPAAVFTANDELGLQAIGWAERLSLRVPEAIAVMGVDNDDLLVESETVSLSSVALPTFKIGFEAAALLDTVMRGQTPDTPRVLLPPVGAVTRKSTDITAITDPDLSAALAFIREHAADPIDVSTVVAAVPVSRRVLERRFQKYLQRSTLEEIQRVHIQRATSLLIDTELSIAEVAIASGFSSRSRFHATFARATGHTPKEYREIHRSR